eukprot:Amastigsp_a4042_13.p3 type:complete len:122 gc:universal Amastigsp_a4042_13:1444-1079(-)
MRGFCAGRALARLFGGLGCGGRGLVRLGLCLGRACGGGDGGLGCAAADATEPRRVHIEDVRDRDAGEDAGDGRQDQDEADHDGRKVHGGAGVEHEENGAVCEALEQHERPDGDEHDGDVDV